MTTDPMRLAFIQTFTTLIGGELDKTFDHEFLPCWHGEHKTYYHFFLTGWQAALSQPAQEWQPIETAPKDGTRVLLIHAQSGFVMGYYKSWQLDGKSGGLWRYEGIHTANVEPTHWMPLPKPPINGGKSE